MAESIHYIWDVDLETPKLISYLIRRNLGMVNVKKQQALYRKTELCNELCCLPNLMPLIFV